MVPPFNEAAWRMAFLKRIDPDQITGGRILPAILGLSMPMLVGALLQNAQSLIDLFWVGRLGSVAVASVAMAGTILMLLYPMLMGLSTGTLALVARAVGAGRTDDAGSAAGQSLFLSVILGGLSAAVGWLVAEPLLHVMGADADVTACGATYLRICLVGSFTVYLLFIGNAALQGAGDAHTPMYVMAASNALNIVLDPLLIFGLGPFPRLGVAGAAWATVLAQAVAAALALWVLLGGNARLHAHWRYWKPDLPLAWRILKIGIPGSGQMLSRSLMNVILMWIVATCGTTAVAAYGIGMRFHFIILMPAFALGGAAATMMGQNLGAGKPDRARRSVWVASGLDALFMLLAGAALMLFARPLIGAFNGQEEVIATGARYLHVVSPFYVFAGFGIVLGRGLNGAGDTLGPMIITVLALWGLQVPLALYLSRVLAPATEGIWWAIAAAFVAQGIMMVAWFESRRWQWKRI